MTPDQTRKARTVIDWLVTAEPGRERAESDAAWVRSVTNRVKAERWAEVCEAVEADPDLSAATIAERLTGKAVAPIPKAEPSPTAALPTYTATQWEPASPEEREHARRRLAEIKAGLKKEASA